jgi:hypothetical protein
MDHLAAWNPLVWQAISFRCSLERRERHIRSQCIMLIVLTVCGPNVRVKLSLCLSKYYAMKTCIHCVSKYQALKDSDDGVLVLNELCFWTLSIVWCLKNKIEEK